MYFLFYHRRLNINKPVRFSEKMYCLKIINGRELGSLLKQCYDKYNVREYVKCKLQSDYVLNKVYSVYNNPEEIIFEELPERFALKVTQSSGSNIICPDKSHLDIDDAKEKLSQWLLDAKSNQYNTEEGYLFDGNPRIICEQYLDDGTGKVPSDIRVYCFNGKPKLFVVDSGTTEIDGSHGHHIIRNVYDENWQLLKIDLGRPHDEKCAIPKPDNLPKIIEVAKKLSEDFYFVRVDLYNIDNKDILFGELTWTPMGGNCSIKPDQYDKILGEWLSIPHVDA